ncbi:undecaprenyl/decaprenyl-phosphate alpha-N-acetylglucosaminyl 1-phosphate transferase [Nakamurella antarctica]|uniref:Undecaprenyl/decaprenyl-phosphate alpha-N-acetylglucosaminyl 1-phosphate transferase n=1 Tax=Nakamurella antarctica TaxID=1902245 RepID=A0A3G8ZLR5_9ACTN|nr:MraY family glycosyltransferase [Nakamurella antarctica]AZI58160.1 undecaprenyl/decaprenyl-phosphate alpha-N-acetylglucosaminyl 1-phosphate transferase [Nakamurella antarctica]
MNSAIPLREYALVFATAVAVTFVVTGIVRIVARKIGAVTPIRDRDVHSVPTPRLGGVAVYIGVAAAFLMARNLPTLKDAFAGNTEILAVLIAGGLICLVGVLDDRFDLDAISKLAGQILAAGLLVVFGVQWLIIQLPGSAEDGPTTLVFGRNEQVIITVLLTVLLINAMNFIDGLDGLLAGVALISAAATFIFSVHQYTTSTAASAAPPPLMAAALAGACIGFLPHNFFPAKIFMGDSGAMFIGLLMAAAISSASFKVDPSLFGLRTNIALLAPLIVALAVVFIPVLDFLLAVIRRTMAGKSPLTADKRHLHHRMLAIGHSHRQAVLIFYLWALVVAGGAVSLALVARWQDMIYWWLASVALALVVSVQPLLRAQSRKQRRERLEADARALGGSINLQKRSSPSRTKAEGTDV